MGLIDRITAMFRPRRAPSLVSVSPFLFGGDVGDVIPGACAVRAVTYLDLEPLADQEVRFRVLAGPLELLPGGTSATVRTDRDGLARVDARFSAAGTAIVVSELVADPRVAVFFRGNSDRVTTRLYLFTDPCIAVEKDEIVTRIFAVDRHEQPVAGAKLFFEALQGSDEAFAGTVTEIGNGQYEGRVGFAHRAGSLTIQVHDLDTHAREAAVVNALPGDPERIRFIGPVDPRAEQPYGELLLRARLEDGFGNALDPHRLDATADGGALQVQSYTDGEARFLIRALGYTSVEVAVADRQSTLSVSTTIAFAAVWLENPGVVIERRKFSTRVFGLPPADRPVERATVEISFEPERTRFVSLRETNPRVRCTSEVQGNLLVISAETKTPIYAEEFPNGIEVCTVQWECLGEGQSCFVLIGKMSPSTPGWKLCVDQKKERKKCICINIITKPGDTADKGKAAAKNVNDILGSTANVEQCCPIITVKTFEHALTAAEWASINTAIGGDGKVLGDPDWKKLNRATEGKRSQCVNLYLIEFDAGTEKGRTGIGSPGTSAIDPAFADIYNFGAHEVGHALGLDAAHTSAGGDPQNVMIAVAPFGAKLTKAQCETIWNNIDSYGNC